MRDTQITIANADTGEIATITRDVATRHAAWVHAQLGTQSEPELQHHLDQCLVEDYYHAGEHLGRDADGLEIRYVPEAFDASVEHNGVTYHAAVTGDHVHITADKAYAGTGRWRNNCIEDCMAVLGGDQETAEEIYELLDDALAARQQEVALAAV